MNLEHVKNKNNNAPLIEEDIEFNFKPITSGLGFHVQKSTDIKPSLAERTVVVSPLRTTSSTQKELNVYQNDLSIFYNQNPITPPLPEEEKIVLEEKVYALATKTQRVFAYLIDLFLLSSVLIVVLSIMARTINMDLMEIWTHYPDEVTPLFVTLFSGFYVIYFSIFDKSLQSTLGKYIFGLRVTKFDYTTLSFVSLLLRSSFSLLNFLSFGLFSYFDLQNKITNSKVIRV
jgi:hypothetical protein